MLFNVWALIWPNQKKILGMVEASAEQIASAKKIALMASRTNTLLSIPMLMCMVGMGARSSLLKVLHQDLETRPMAGFFCKNTAHVLLACHANSI